VSEDGVSGADVGLPHAGRVALVTGGAGAIAGAICRRLADEGADVVVVDRDADRTDAMVAEVEARGRRAVGVVADLTDDGAVEHSVATATSALGGVDILVNALGEHLWLAKPFERSTPADWDALYRVNLLATMRASHAVLPLMQARGWGRIVNFSSVEGIRAMPNAAPYTAFKAAIDGFTRSLGVEVARSGVRVNAIAVDKTRSHQVGFYRMGEEWERHVPVWVPAGRYGEPDDVAAVAAFLASDAADWIVGQTIAADGGTLAAGGWYRTPTRWTNSPLLVQYFDDDPEANRRRPPMLR
jgi:NAD(P)-dependent dehydrogenase (short-subunit alcohol dehydrogenase family)